MISSSKHRYLKNFQDLRIGDVLTVRTLDWFYENAKPTEVAVYNRLDEDGFSRDMAEELGGRKVTVVDLDNSMHYYPSGPASFKRTISILEDGGAFTWHDWMFEECEEPEIEK